ncbi:MAG TPA: selenocysteine-specific translation elongation factor [Terriglobales bacterium]|jgi:selenocysteine-specific elongation factor|nr:selenocysteine-specific translation elongation factor [Terriglobales bacterium]
MKSVIVGTAGHIDHGKTSLVKALTGIDADRLEEEKRRGITIDIGFAHFELPAPNGSKIRVGFVDVPGHERFVRNMLAGVGGIDLVLLVIAADEGIKPQTREHFDICRLLAIRRGITVLTKSDAVDAETLEVVRLEVEDYVHGSFLDTALDPPQSPIIAVSSLTGAGLDELKSALARVASEVTAKDSAALTRLPIDRVFTMKGFGTVVTGTLVAGTIRKEEELEVFPGGKRVRIRGVQVHGASTEAALAGQRTALNLAGVSTDDLARGITLATADTFRSTSRVDALLSLLPSAKPLRDGARVHFHAYTMETIAEVRLYGTKQLKPGDEAYAQLRFAEPTLLLPADRFIVRQFSPVITIGGGVVLDASPAARRQRVENALAFLQTIREGPPERILAARVARRGANGLQLNDVIGEMNIRWEEVTKLAGKAGVVQCDQLLLSPDAFAKAKADTLQALKKFHDANPLVAGMSKEELRDRVSLISEVFHGVLGKLTEERKLEVTGEVVHLQGRGVVMKDEEAESKKIIEQAFASAGLKVPSLKEVLAGLKVDKTRAQKIVTLLLRDKVLTKISEELVFHQSALADLRQKIAALKTTTPKIDVARFKDMTGVTRKYAIPLLEYLDRERVTRRVGDERVIL